MEPAASAFRSSLTKNLTDPTSPAARKRKTYVWNSCARTHTHTERCGLWSGHASPGWVDYREDVRKRTRPSVSQIRKKMHANSAMKILSRKLSVPRDTLLPGWSSASSNIEPGAVAHSAQSHQHRHKHPPCARATAVHQPAVGSSGLAEELIPPSPGSVSSHKNKHNKRSVLP